MSILANEPLVAVGPESVVEAPLPPSSLQEHPDTGIGGTNQGVLGPSSGLLHFRENLSKSLDPHGLEPEDLNFISQHLSKGPAANYGYSWTKFTKFCRNTQWINLLVPQL